MRRSGVSAAHAQDSGDDAPLLSNLVAGEVVLEYDEAQIAQKQAVDRDFAALVEYLKNNRLPADNSRARKILLEADKYVLLGEHQVLMRIDDSDLKAKGSVLLMCVPHSMRKQVLEMHHDFAFGGAHMGRLKTLERVRKRYFWPGLPTDVVNYVKRHVISVRPLSARESRAHPSMRRCPLGQERR